MVARKLRAVPSKPALRRADPQKSKLAAAADSSEREMLVILRRKLADQIDAGVSAHALAAMTRQLLKIDQDIRSIDSQEAELAEAEAEAEARYVDGDVDETFDMDAI